MTITNDVVTVTPADVAGFSAVATTAILALTNGSSSVVQLLTRRINLVVSDALTQFASNPQVNTLTPLAVAYAAATAAQQAQVAPLISQIDTILGVASTLPPVPPPQNVAVFPGNNQTEIFWQPAGPLVASYGIKRSTISGAETNLAIVSGGNSNVYIDNTALNGTKYFYTVVSMNAGGAVSGPSTEVFTTPTAGSQIP